MLGSLIKTTLEARARRELLLLQAAKQRQRMTVYLDAFDPAARWVERLIGAVKFLFDRPVIPASVLAIIVILKPRRALKVAVLAWKAVSWVRRIKTVLR